MSLFDLFHKNKRTADSIVADQDEDSRAMHSFGAGEKSSPRGEETPATAEQAADQLDEDHGWDIGLGGVSIKEFMDQFNEDLAPDESLERAVSAAAAIEIVTSRDYPGAKLSSEDEAQQQLMISKGGLVVLRTMKYFKGKGHYSIGRYEKANIAPSTVSEIFNLMDTWLFMTDLTPWNKAEDRGSWTLRVSHDTGHAEMMRGALTGASVDGIDLSQFIRVRIPIRHLFLFE